MKVLLEKSRPTWRREFLCLLVPIAFSYVEAHAADLEREFVWKTSGKNETLHVKVPVAMHQHYASKARTFQYGNYTKEDGGYELTAKLASAFDSRAAENNLNEWEKINLVIDFVQSLQYQTETGEYPKYPIETINDRGGDCEDTAILLAAIFDKMGIDCVLLSPTGHMAVGVAITGLTGRHYLWAGKKYFYVETTGQNWEIGMVPPAYEGVAKIYELPAAIAARKTIAYDALQVEASKEETVLLLAFYRSPKGEEDPQSRETLYRYRVHLETDKGTLAEVKEVQYRRMEPDASELGRVPWMRAYDVANQFGQEWVSADYVPIQVRIYFKDGTLVQTLIDFSPTIGGE